jgi:hypothetical protein
LFSIDTDNIYLLQLFDVAYICIYMYSRAGPLNMENGDEGEDAGGIRLLKYTSHRRLQGREEQSTSESKVGKRTLVFWQARIAEAASEVMIRTSNSHSL